MIAFLKILKMTIPSMAITEVTTKTLISPLALLVATGSMKSVRNCERMTAILTGIKINKFVIKDMIR